MTNELTKCANCGNEFPYYLKTCPKCGTQKEVELKRHGFITFWLWASCIINIFAILALTAFGISSGLYLETIAILLPGIITISGIFLLLNWKKYGFYIVILGNLISILLSTVILGFDFLSIIQSVVSLLILYAILNIKKNDIPYWEAMDMK